MVETRTEKRESLLLSLFSCHTVYNYREVFLRLNNEFFNGDFKSDWLAGLLAADGYVSNDGRYWNLSQSADKGRELVEVVKNMIDSTAEIRSRKTKLGSDAHSLHTTSKKMCDDLERLYGVVTRKTYTYSGPSDERFTKEFIRGYIDGDGCIGRYRTGACDDYLVITMVGTPEFIARLNKTIPVKGSEYRVKNSKNLTELRWNGSRAFDFGNWLYSGHTLPHTSKYKIFTGYVDEVYSNPPSWLSNRAKNDYAIRLWKSGVSMVECGRVSGIGHNVYRVIRKLRAEDKR